MKASLGVKVVYFVNHVGAFFVTSLSDLKYAIYITFAVVIVIIIIIVFAVVVIVYGILL